MCHPRAIPRPAGNFAEARLRTESTEIGLDFMFMSRLCPNPLLMTLRRLCFATTVLAIAACARPLPPADPAMIAEWMQNYYGLIRAERISPPVASRVLAYASIGLYEGLASATPGMRSLAGQLNGLEALPRAEPGQAYDPTLVALASERTVLDTLFKEGLPATRAALGSLIDSLAAARLALGVSEEVHGRSAALGSRIGNAILAWAARDGFDSTRTKPYRAPTGPQYWVNDARVQQYVAQNISGAQDFVALDNPADTLEAGAADERAIILNRPKSGGIQTLKALNPTGATEPWWGDLRPFALDSAFECQPPPPIPYSTDPASDLYREAMVVYQTDQANTDSTRAVALYWADNPGQTGTPVGHWLSIGSQLVSQRRLSAEEAAAVFVLATIAQADAFIGAFAVKYRYSLLRPNTYIRRLIDPAWEPFIVTPAFPTYPSAHSVQSAAAATVLTGLLGEVPFEDSTNLSLGHPVRRFATFWDASREAAMSRLYGGIHFPMDNNLGLNQGRCIGEKVLARVRTRPEAGS
jgi:hypothetical protein